MSDIPAENTPSRGVRGLGSGARTVTQEFYAQASEAVFDSICDNVGEEVARLLVHGAQPPKVRRNGFEFVDTNGGVWECLIDRYFIGIPSMPGQEGRIQEIIRAAHLVVSTMGPGERAIDKVQEADAFHTTLMYQGRGDIVFSAKDMLDGRSKTTAPDDEGSFSGHMSAEPIGPHRRENNVRDLYASAAEAFSYFREGDPLGAAAFDFDRCAHFRHPGYDRPVFTTALVPSERDEVRIRNLHRTVWDVDSVRRGTAQNARIAKRRFVPHNTLVQTNCGLAPEVSAEVCRAVDALLAAGPVVSDYKLRGWARLRLWNPDARNSRDYCSTQITWMDCEAKKTEDYLALMDRDPLLVARDRAKLERIRAEIIRLREGMRPTSSLKHAKLYDIA